MARPTRVQVIEAHDHEDGLYLWVDADGTELCFLVPREAIPDRKFKYGYSRRIEVTNEQGGLESERFEDLTSDADDLALRAILAEHFDRFEETGHDFHTQAAPPRFQSGTQRRRDMEKPVDVPSRTPPENKRVVVERSQKP